MADDERAPFEQLAAEDKVRSQREREIYEATRPKRPLSSFLLFSNERRAAVRAALPHGAPIGDVARELGAQWRALSDAEKQPYKDQAAALKAKAQETQ